MVTSKLRIAVRDGFDISAILNRPEDCHPGTTPGLVLAHGANNDLEHPLLALIATWLADNGVASVLRFNFPYAERGTKSPDAGDVLMTAFRLAHDALADDPVCAPGAMFLGGKSMGARIAAELVSRHHEGEGLLTAGLVFLGYPLHAPGGKDRLRTGPLRRIDVPSIFVQGTRDPFCDLELLRPVVRGLDRPGILYLIEGGGHSYELPKAAGRTSEEVYAEVAAEAARFIRTNV